MRQKSTTRTQKLTGYLFLTPAALMIVIFMIIPLVWNIVLSFCAWNGNSAVIFKGFENYVHLFTDRTIRVTLQRSIFMALVSTVVAMGLGLIYAFFLYRMKEKEQVFFRFIFFSPAMLPMTIIGVLFVFVLSSNGLLNSVFSLIGLDSLQHAWLADPDTALLVLGIIQGWKQSGVVMLLCATALMTLPSSLYECAVLEGANYWDQVKMIMMPLIKPTIKLLMSMVLMSGFKSYDIVYSMTQGGPGEFTYTAPMKIIQVGFTYNEYGTASALGTMLVIIAALFVIVARVALKGETYEY